MATVQLLNPWRFRHLDGDAMAAWLEQLLVSLAPDADTLAVRFVPDGEMQRLNRDYRARDETTDVLSFPGGETPEGWHLGDIAIAVPTARRQAAAAGHELERELRRLILHGVLHCLGHDHEADGGEMERLETELRRRWLEPRGRGG